jgi:hypothetical protein
MEDEVVKTLSQRAYMKLKVVDLTFVTILPLTITANYRLSSQFLSVGLKVGVRVWYKVSVRFGIINNSSFLT